MLRITAVIRTEDNSIGLILDMAVTEITMQLVFQIMEIYQILILCFKLLRPMEAEGTTEAEQQVMVLVLKAVVPAIRQCHTILVMELQRLQDAVVASRKITILLTNTEASMRACLSAEDYGAFMLDSL